MGLISSQFSRDLHLIRRIRNEFAHNVAGCSFAHSGVRDRVNELFRACKFAQHEQKLGGHVPSDTRGHFQYVVSWMLWRLWSLVHDCESIKEYPLEWGYDPHVARPKKRKRKA
jgi:hypothetical protein